MKPALIVGKGPSARPVDLSEDYCVAALNGAVRMCEHADYLFANDDSALAEFTFQDLATRVEVMVLPTHLHLATNGRQVRSVRKYQSILRRKQVLMHALPSADKLYIMKGPILRFGRQQSVAETAVACLIHMGHRDFYTVGVDVEGGYHTEFSEDQQVRTKRKDWYRTNWLRIAHRIRLVGGTLTRLVPEGYPHEFNVYKYAKFKPKLKVFTSLVGDIDLS